MDIQRAEQIERTAATGPVRCVELRRQSILETRRSPALEPFPGQGIELSAGEVTGTRSLGGTCKTGLCPCLTTRSCPHVPISA